MRRNKKTQTNHSIKFKKKRCNILRTHKKLIQTAYNSCSDSNLQQEESLTICLDGKSCQRIAYGVGFVIGLSIGLVLFRRTPLFSRSSDRDSSGCNPPQNGKCNIIYNSEKCNWDRGKCEWFNKKYPDCSVLKNGENRAIVEINLSSLDTPCNQESNTEECGWDFGACIAKNEFVDKYPHCELTTSSLMKAIGDGQCDSQVSTIFNQDCEWDGGDCDGLGLEDYPHCIVDSPTKIGDGKCESTYNNELCGWDGGDCFVEGYPDCHVNGPNDIGNGFCNRFQYNKEACGWDGGDCVVEGYPDCHVDYPQYIGNGHCHLSEDGYNTGECGFDGGDCVSYNKFKEKYPDCVLTIWNHYYIGNGRCEKDNNKEECGWDGGDCIEFNKKYPNCTAYYDYYIGDGVCERIYNTTECGYDGGDCL